MLLVLSSLLETEELVSVLKAEVLVSAFLVPESPIFLLELLVSVCPILHSNVLPLSQPSPPSPSMSLSSCPLSGLALSSVSPALTPVSVPDDIISLPFLASFSEPAFPFPLSLPASFCVPSPDETTEVVVVDIVVGVVVVVG